MHLPVVALLSSLAVLLLANNVASGGTRRRGDAELDRPMPARGRRLARTPSGRGRRRVRAMASPAGGPIERLHLFDAGDVEETSQRMVDLVVETADGCNRAGLSFVATITSRSGAERQGAEDR